MSAARRLTIAAAGVAAVAVLACLAWPSGPPVPAVAPRAAVVPQAEEETQPAGLREAPRHDPTDPAAGRGLDSVRNRDLVEILRISRPVVGTDFAGVMRCRIGSGDGIDADGALQGHDPAIGPTNDLTVQDGWVEAIVLAPAGSADLVLEGFGVYSLTWSDVPDMGVGACAIEGHTDAVEVLSGVVLDPDGHVLAGADVLSCSHQERTDENGAFEVEVPMGGDCPLSVVWRRGDAFVSGFARLEADGFLRVIAVDQDPELRQP